MIAQRFSQLEPLPQSIKEIVDIIDNRYPYFRPLKEALQCGVAYHNSSLPRDVRIGIERAVEKRALKVVAATTTLAEGVDLPFRVTILSDWLTFNGAQALPMESLLFKNISGRCGRAGQFTEGDTVVFDNPVGDRQLTAPAQRHALQRDIFFNQSQPALSSAIGRVERRVAVAAVGSQLLAAIRENPDTDDLYSTFLGLSFAHQTGNATAVADRVKQAYEDILSDSTGEPLAIAASPAKLTPFGEIVSKSGLSPRTARMLRDALAQFSSQAASRDDLVAIGVGLLKSLASVIEQGNPELRKAIENPRSYPVVRPNELELVLTLWLAGTSIEEIFASLPANQRSTRQPSLSAWLLGVSEDSTWTDQFAKFYDFLDQSIHLFLPWMLRASGSLSEIDGHAERPWGQWARYAELGVDNAWAIRLIDGNAVDDRAVACEIGRRLDGLMLGTEPTTEQMQTAASAVLADDNQAMARVMDWHRRRVPPSPAS